MADLHLLAFLLTADEEKAEQCFVSGLEDSIQGNPVFRKWARSWSKRAIIKNAIKVVAPATTLPDAEPDQLAGAEKPRQNPLISAVTALSPLDRFVFVMTVLECYSVHECSVLLERPVSDVIPANSRALKRLGSLRSAAPTDRGASWTSVLTSSQTA